jgi:serine/threonine protein kinase
MLSGEPPWKAYGINDIIQLCIFLESWTGGPPLNSLTVSPRLRPFLEACFRKDPLMRATVENLLKMDLFAYRDNRRSESVVLAGLCEHDITRILVSELTLSEPFCSRPNTSHGCKTLGTISNFQSAAKGDDGSSSSSIDYLDSGRRSHSTVQPNSISK